jgi:L-alanine-DL-glutamate epimerase-like enolase superfamily enzyme
MPEKVTVYPLRIKREREMFAGTFSYQNYQSVIVAVEFEGIEGYGEAMSRYEPLTLAKIVKYMFEMIRGKTIKPKEAFETIYSSLRVRGHTRGLEIEALSGIEMALWDIYCKIKKKSLATILGGEKRKSFSVLAGSVSCRASDLKKRIEQIKSLSIAGFKLKIGFGLQRDYECARNAKKLWEDAKVVLDSNCGYTFDNALLLSKKVKGIGIEWFEEPFYPDSFDDYLRLRRVSDVRIGGGESWFVKDLEDAVRLGLVDVLEPSVSRCGGVRIFHSAAKHAIKDGIAVCPMVGANSSLSLAASLQLASSLGLELVEYDPFDNPLYRVTEGFPSLHSGKLLLPSGDGIGVELDKRFLRRTSLKVIE